MSSCFSKAANILGKLVKYLQEPQEPCLVLLHKVNQVVCPDTDKDV